jgi:hypothetical protein
MMGVRRQTSNRQVDAPPIEELTTRRQRDEHHRAAALDDTDGGYGPDIARRRHRLF